MEKLVYVAEAFGGGVLSFLREITHVLSADYEITILYGRRNETPDQLSAYFDSQINLIEIKAFQRALNLYPDWQAYRELSFWLQKINPEIVHLNSSKAGYLGRLLSYPSKTKVFYSPHGYSFLMHDSSKAKRQLYFIAEKILGLRSRVKTVGVGLSEYHEAQKVTKNAAYVNNGVDLAAIDTLKSQDFAYQNAIITVGRINEQKAPARFNYLAEAFPKQHFIWVGTGPLREQLTAKNITVLGWLPHEQVISILKQTKIFVLLSKWEGLSMSLLEAMYCQNACLVSDIASNREVIGQNKNGLLVRNSTEAISGLAELLVNGQKYALKGKEQVAQNYSLDQMAAGYRKLYQW